MQIVKYQTEEESQKIIAEKTAQGLILIAVSNVTEGNFLGFKEPYENTTAEKTPIEARLDAIEAKLDSILVKQEEITTNQLAAVNRVIAE